MKYILFLLGLSQFLYAQESITDTLPDTQVQSFLSTSQWKSVPAAIGLLEPGQKKWIAPQQIVSRFNLIAGVRMEERSPGSYRLAIRGSLLRSPFGIRNIRVYYNGFSLTDATGNTYLNLLDATQIYSGEVMKGPVASIYGAGTTGGVILQSKPSSVSSKNWNGEAGVSIGSFGLSHQYFQTHVQNKKLSSSFYQSRIHQTGYREQSLLHRDAFQWNAKWRLSPIWNISTLVLWTGLYYQTPGGLTRSQFQANPRMARPPAGTLAGAIQQQSSIRNNTLFTGIGFERNKNNNTSQIFIQHSTIDFTNPFITNYEKRKEENWGVRVVQKWDTKLRNDRLVWNIGGEFQSNKSSIQNWINLSGIPGNLLVKDIVFAQQGFTFAQIEWVSRKWTTQLGTSFNFLGYSYIREFPTNSPKQNISPSSPLAPRISVGYSINNNQRLYASLSRGFSAPSLAEIRPSTNQFAEQLMAEYGWNIELGWKGFLFNRSLRFDVSAYHFTLQNAIVRQLSQAGVEYFINAGSVQQSGVDLSIQHQTILNKQQLIDWSFAYSFQPYQFLNYPNGPNNFKNNRLTGVPRHQAVIGAKYQLNKKWYLTSFLQSVGRLPLQDSNENFADAFLLGQIKFGYQINGKNKQWDCFLLVDNVFNQQFSLGNDINAAGARFFNAAPTRAVQAGVKLSW